MTPRQLDPRDPSKLYRGAHGDPAVVFEPDDGVSIEAFELDFAAGDDEEYVGTLRWLAAFPFIDETWLGFGHSIPMPEPIIAGSELTAFLLLTPIIGRHTRLADQLTVAGEPIELLVVHLLTTAEYRLKMSKGSGAILDLFDEHAYPLVLDPARRSMV